MNSTVVETEHLILVVDPGYLPNEIMEIWQFVEGLERDKPIFLFFTHSDFDHISGNELFPNAQTIASRQFVDSCLKSKQLHDLIRFDDDLYIDRNYQVKYPNINIIIDTDGQELKIGDTIISFYQAFGHTDDSLFAVVENKNILLAGDYLSNLEFPFVYHSFREYEKTLNSFSRVASDKKYLMLIPGHGSVTEDHEEIIQRIKASEDYFQILKDDQDEEEFKKFLLKNGYRHQTSLFKRHQENLMIWNDQE
jgi:glyoxylase-like metal-dependent hydrolase (beta-lactamase superfamily II)